jgi:large subunit ribosomal protein L21e
MVRKKNVREKGKLSLSRYFQKLKKGEHVAIVRELSIDVNFPKRLQGRTGIIEGERGKSYIVDIKDINKEKRHIISPIHLKKIRQVQK